MRRILTRRALFGVLVVVAAANVLMFAVERWIAVPLRVPSASMEPVLQGGDRILVPHLSDDERRADAFERGEVVVFHAPDPGRPLVVKRIVGLPGETIEAVDGYIAIDNQNVLAEPWLPDAERERGSTGARSVDIPRTKLADDELFVLGDNRDRSVDSREFGPIRLRDIVGRATIRIWPPGRFGTVEGA